MIPSATSAVPKIDHYYLNCVCSEILKSGDEITDVQT